jgi:hypothetical protein
MKIVEQYNGDPPSLFVRSFLVTFSDAADLDEHTRRESILDGLPDLGHAHPSDDSLVCIERWLSMVDPLRMQAVCRYGARVKAKGIDVMSNQCDGCRFFQQVWATNGQCRRYPPKFSDSEDQRMKSIGLISDPLYGYFPRVLASEWCGEFEAKSNA